MSSKADTTGGVFNISNYAKNRVEKKRKYKGLSELTPR